MSTLFGITIPVPTIVGVFPIDPDYEYAPARKWPTTTHKMSPLLYQKYITSPAPQITIDCKFSVMRGAFALAGSKFKLLYDFYLSTKGRSLPFYFYDPSPWGASNPPYCEDPTQRPNSPGTGVNPAPTTGRYIVHFVDDILSVEHFAAKLRKSGIQLTGYAG